jgi:hypothetical protein
MDPTRRSLLETFIADQTYLGSKDMQLMYTGTPIQKTILLSGLVRKATMLNDQLTVTVSLDARESEDDDEVWTVEDAREKIMKALEWPVIETPDYGEELYEANVEAIRNARKLSKYLGVSLDRMFTIIERWVNERRDLATFKLNARVYLPHRYLEFLSRPNPPPIQNMTYISEVFQRERRELSQVGKLGIPEQGLIDTVEQLFVGIWISKMVSLQPRTVLLHVYSRSSRPVPYTVHTRRPTRTFFRTRHQPAHLDSRDDQTSVRSSLRRYTSRNQDAQYSSVAVLSVSRSGLRQGVEVG